MNTRSWAGAIAALAMGVGSVAQAQQKLSVEEAVQEALKASDSVKSARYQVEGNQATAASARGRMLPVLSVQEDFQHYNSPFTVRFPFPAAPGGALAFVARNQNTNAFTAQAAQPILGLFQAGYAYGAAEQQAEAAKKGELAVESATREAVESGILRLYEARAQQDIAKTSVAQLTEQLDQARNEFKAGVNTKADVLRFETALANARQQEIQAGVQELVSKAQLMTQLGRNVHDASIDFQAPDLLEQQAAKGLPGEESATTQALSARPEVFQAQAQARSAHLNAVSAGFGVMPEVDVVTAYQNIQGQLFAPYNQAYIGLHAQWAVWDWGTKWFQGRAAHAQALAAAAQEEDQRRNVALDASTRLEEARAAGVAVEVAQQAIASAEEAFRVTSSLMKAGSATTTDLLDSQSALTQAKLNYSRARYERAIARVSLERALGH